MTDTQNTITFTANGYASVIRIAITRETATEITGVRLPADRYGYGEKTWLRDEIAAA